MKLYKINHKTMAILCDGKGASVIYEDKRFFIMKIRPTAIIKKNCLNFGLSLDTAIKKTKNLIGVNYKPPIIVNEYKNQIFFPTKSIRLPDNEWICLNHIKNFYENKRNHRTIVEFKNGKLLEFDISYNVMQNQIMRAYFLQSKNISIISKKV